MAKRGLKVKVEGLSELAEIPGWLDDGQRRFLRKAADGIAEKIAEVAPGGKGGSVGRAVKGRTLSATKAEIVVEHPGARVLEEGGVIKPKGKALKFQIGGRTVFVHRSSRRRKGSAGAPPGSVFVPGRRFGKKGLRSRHKIVRTAYQDAMGDLRKSR